ncbi:MAG: ferritin family protein [Candidatus Riflebacteria bacterium]|nr:ferritin family protein [Candidatus Riflebacteria bacterium]
MHIFEFARAQEIRAEKTYRECAQCATSREMQRVFTMLATAEKRHLETILEMEKGKAVLIDVTDILTVAKGFLEKLVPNKMALQVPASKLEVYLEARRQEEVAQRFYSESAKNTLDPGKRDVLDSLAAEENSHYQLLDWIIELVQYPEKTLENAEFRSL